MLMEEIAPDVYISTFYPGINVGFVVTDGGAVAVDAPPLPADARAWRKQILQTAGGPIRYAVLTDPHPDRLLGLGWLRAPVVVGTYTLRWFKEGGETLWRSVFEEWGRRQPEGKDLELPPFPSLEVAVDGRMTLHGSTPVVVGSVAGASPGSIWVRLPQQEVLFAGDTVVVGTHPRLAAASDTRAWLETLVELRRARFPARLIVPGRGPVSQKEDTRPLSEYIQQVRRRIRSLHAGGGRRADLVRLVPEFLSLFPVKEEERGWIQQEVQAGLERVFDELAPEEEV